MFSNKIRLTLIILTVLIGIYLIYFNDKNGYLFLFGALLLVYGYFRYSTVFHAFKKIRMNDFDGAEKMLNQIKNSDLLAKGQKSYYHWSKGLIYLKNDKLIEAFKEIEKALELGLRTDNDNALATLNLAEVSARKGEKEKAKYFISQAKTFKYKPLVDKYIEEIESNL